MSEFRTHGHFMDNLIHQYVNNRLDEGYSWKEMRTGIPCAEKGVTRFSAGVRKTLVDRLIAGQKFRSQMLKEMSLKEVETLTARAAHEPILYENSASYKTKMAVHGDKRKKKKDTKPNRIRKRCQFCLTQGRKETKTQFCCAECGDVSLYMQEDVTRSCWTLWHKKVYAGMSNNPKKK